MIGGATDSSIRGAHMSSDEEIRNVRRRTEQLQRLKPLWEKLVAANKKANTTTTASNSEDKKK
jgi:hypothetical protein